MLVTLPLEILQTIIDQKSLTIKDLMNLSSTCSYLRGFILTNNLMWKNHYVEKWPKIAKNSPKIENYFDETRHSHEICKNVDEILMKFAVDFIEKEHLSDKDFEPFNNIINSRYLNKDYIESYLREILNNRSEINTDKVIPLKTPGNLTFKLYSLATLCYLSHIDLEKAWNEFYSLKEEDQLLEIGAIMLSQWCKPQDDIQIENVQTELDNIANEVRKFLKATNPNHPLFNIDENDLILWRNKIFFESKFSSKACKEILEAMRQVVCYNMDFYGNRKDYYHPNNSFITDVLKSKRGLPITLSILYESVARRLGVNLEPMNTPVHFLLRFCEHDTYKREEYYVDVFNRGEVIPAGVYTLDGTVLNPPVRASTQTVIERMVNNLEISLRDQMYYVPDNGLPLLRSVLELSQILHPYDLRSTLVLARYYMRFGIDTTRIEELLQSDRYANRAPVNDVLYLMSMNEFEPRSTTRSVRRGCRKRDREEDGTRDVGEREVEFAVGMVMRHKLFNYTCVIYGWDSICKESNAWKRQMKIDQLQYGAEQPFYQVLVEDGTKRYAAQENLIFSGVKNGLDKNPEVGRYFTHFFKNQFVPNCVKNDEYPDDFEVRKRFDLKM